MSLASRSLKALKSINMSPATLIFIGTGITIFGAVVVGFATYLHNTASSEKSTTTLNKVTQLEGQNEKLRSELRKSNDKLDKANQKIDDLQGIGYPLFDLIGQGSGNFVFVLMKNDKLPSYNVRVKVLNTVQALTCKRDGQGRYSLKCFDSLTWQKEYGELGKRIDLTMSETRFHIDGKHIGNIMQFEIEFASRAINVHTEIFYKLSVGRCDKVYRCTEIIVKDGSNIPEYRDLITVDTGIGGFSPVWGVWKTRRYYVGD